MADKGRKASDKIILHEEHSGILANFSDGATSEDDGLGPRGARYEETRDSLILGFNVVREISEANDLLAPLKATGLLIVRGLEITKVYRLSCFPI
jgi:hypothetical protein